MNSSTVLEALTVFLGLLQRFNAGDARATARLKDILPARTYTRMVREREREKDRAKFG